MLALAWNIATIVKAALALIFGHTFAPACLTCLIFVGPLSRVRPRNGILALVLVVLVVLVVLPLRSEFIGEL